MSIGLCNCLILAGELLSQEMRDKVFYLMAAARVPPKELVLGLSYLPWILTKSDSSRLPIIL